MDLNDSLPDCLERARAGDQAAAAEICLRFFDSLTKLARARLDAALRGKEDPEDVVQSVLKSVLKPCPVTTHSTTRSHKVWGLLATITIRKCIERRRKFLSPKHDVRREVALTPADDSAGNWAVLDTPRLLPTT